MTTGELIDYIKSQLNKNIPKYLIISRLIEVGWRMEDIEEGFSNIEPKVALPVAEPIKPVEPQVFEPVIQPVELEKPTVEPVVEPLKQEEPKKIWTPIVVEPKTVDVSKPSAIELYNLEIEQAEKPVVEVASMEEAPKTITHKFEVSNIEIPKEEAPVEALVEMPAEELIPTINKEVKPSSEYLDLQRDSQAILDPYIDNAPVVKANMSDVVPRTAMISSYSQDILSANTTEESPKPVIQKKSIIKILIVILICSFVGGMVFAFVSGSIKLPGFKKSFSIVKKDPRSIILNTPNNISKLKSYKIESEVTVSSPSFSSITTGLASGEAVTSKDKESIAIIVKGMANHVNNKLVFDNLVTLKSSILENDIVSDWKYDGSTFYVSVPDLNLVIGKDAPAPALVQLTPDQLGTMVPQFSPEIADMIKKVDIYNVMSEGVPLYVRTEATSIVKEFINSTEYTGKGKEDIHGVSTYHYELTADRPSTKKLVGSLVDLLTMKLPADQRQNLDEAIGASSITAFEVWIGENDDNLYQIKFTLNMPLSRVLGLNDSGIGDNEVKLEWRTTYFDIDVENKIDMPSDAIDMKTFINNKKDTKIKSMASAFLAQATVFKNAVGSYGSRSNPTGSCTNPNPSSLFSPKGHKKSADTAIASISASMNSLLSDTNGLGSCYSTSTAWAIALPLFSNPDPANPSYYCTDSSGNTTTLTNAITGPICK